MAEEEEYNMSKDIQDNEQSMTQLAKGFISQLTIALIIYTVLCTIFMRVLRGVFKQSRVRIRTLKLGQTKLNIRFNTPA